jgi:hypothetical protein
MKFKSGDIILDIYNDMIHDIDSTGISCNYIVIPMAVFNVLENSRLFHVTPGKKIDQLEGITFIGFFGTYKCYVDLIMPPNQILIKSDRQTLRDNKLESILNSKDSISELVVNIDYSHS